MGNVIRAIGIGWMLVLGSAMAQPAATTEPVARSIGPAPTPGKWENFWIGRVKEFIEENRTLDPKQRYIVFLGDSLTQGFKLKEYFPDLPVLNRGIVSDGGCDFPNGRDLYRGVTRRIEESIFACRPSYLIYLIGTNDVGMTSVPLEYWMGAYKFVIGQTRVRFPETKIVLVTCPPTGKAYAKWATLNPRIEKWNEMIRAYGKEQGFRVIDLYELLVGKDGFLPEEMTRDGLHFNKVGYEKWTQAVKEILKEDRVTVGK